MLQSESSIAVPFDILSRIVHALAWNLTLATAVKGRRLTA
jgi:hypothetical protein